MKQTIYLIFDVDYGDTLGAGIDYPSAVEFLIKEGLINNTTERWTDDSELTEDIGEDWANIMCNKWSVKEFNEYWVNIFWIETTDLYQRNNN